jgi:hypothetical protein
MSAAELTLSPTLSQRVATSRIPIVRDLGLILSDLARLKNLVDRPFRWRETPRNVFGAKLALVRTTPELNAIYWRDVASSIKAYCLSTTWRIIELAEHVLLLLDHGGVLGPAVIARSLMELATVYVLNGGNIRELVSGAAAQWHDKFVLSEDLENLLNKALYGSRMVPEGDPLRQTNILTLMQKLSKNPGWEDLTSYYDRLCEVAHPNMAGNARFWGDIVAAEADGTLITIGSPNVNNDAIIRLVDDTLWALAWSAANCIAGFGTLSAQVETIRQAYPSPTDAA